MITDLNPSNTDFQYNAEVAAQLEEKDYNVILTNKLANLTIDKPSIIILTSDEWGNLPSYHNNPNVILVAKHHHRYHHSLPKIFEMPMGWVTGLEPRNISCKDRQYDFGFAGQYGCDKACNRGDLKRALESCQHPGNFLWHFTDRYAGGPGMDWYNDLINDSKFFLCPLPLCNIWYNDTTRLFDAFAAGCIPVTPHLYHKWYTYRLKEAAIVLDEWNNFENHINVDIEVYQRRSLNYYHKLLSPSSVASIINLYIMSNYNYQCLAHAINQMDFN